MRCVAAASVLSAAMPSATRDRAAKKCRSGPCSSAQPWPWAAACSAIAGSASQRTCWVRVRPSRRLPHQAGRRRRDRPARPAGGSAIRPWREFRTPAAGDGEPRCVAGQVAAPRYNRATLRSPVPLPMFESLTQRLSGTLQRLRGRGRLSEENIRESLREVRIALLEADVALPVVVALIERIKVRAVGQEVLTSLTPGPGADQGRARRNGRGDGLAGQRAQPQRAGAGDHPDGRPAGRGQDHHGRPSSPST